MTFEELFTMPFGMNFEEYDKLLKEQKRLRGVISKASDDIQGEENSLDVLSDEVGSERYERHYLRKQKLEKKRAKAQENLNKLEELLRR